MCGCSSFCKDLMAFPLQTGAPLATDKLYVMAIDKQAGCPDGLKLFPIESVVSQAHLFANKNLVSGANTFTLPASAQSPIGRYQVTARRAIGAPAATVGSEVAVRLTGATAVNITLDSSVALTNVDIYVNPIFSVS